MASNKVVTAKAKPASKPKGIPKGRLKHIHVEPADNKGFTVTSRHEVPPPKGGKKGSMQPFDFDGGQHTAVFGNPQDTMAHIGSLIGAAGGGPPSAGSGDQQAPAASDSDGDEGE